MRPWFLFLLGNEEAMAEPQQTVGIPRALLYPILFKLHYWKKITGLDLFFSLCHGTSCHSLHPQGLSLLNWPLGGKKKPILCFKTNYQQKAAIFNFFFSLYHKSRETCMVFSCKLMHCFLNSVVNLRNNTDSPSIIIITNTYWVLTMY